MRFASGYGNGRSSTAFTIVNNVVVAPIPSANVTAAIAVNSGRLRSARRARRSSFIYRAPAPRAPSPHTSGRPTLQLAVEELRRRLVRLQPVPVQQEVVHFVRKDQLLELHALRPQRLHDVHRLAERHVAVIVAVD